jgi:hypothetical protein
MFIGGGRLREGERIRTRKGNQKVRKGPRRQKMENSFESFPSEYINSS